VSHKELGGLIHDKETKSSSVLCVNHRMFWWKVMKLVDLVIKGVAVINLSHYNIGICTL